jgi:hypothetical protein
MEKIYVPPGFYCPITGDIINNPVTDHEGNSYEKSEILKWISTNKTSPLTRSYLDESLLHDDICLKRNIDSIREKLTEEQLKIDSRISEIISVPFQSTLDGITLQSYYIDNQLYVSINTPNIDTRPPVDIVLCIDVSYSMFNEATLKGESNETVSHGFSVLSLTISAAKTILHSLNENDNLSIVTYSSESKTLFENISCSPENKIMIERGLDTLKPISNTNMWAGIQQSLDILRTTSPIHKIKGVLLLTDGVPNVVPPRGHVHMLEKYFKQHNFKCMISCYGFGYNLESDLLSEISQCSGGDGYSFIPDASLLGTTFIHGISNLFTTAAYNPSLTITLSKDLYFMDKKQSLEMNIDSLKYGKSKNLVFSIHREMGGDVPEILTPEYVSNCINISLNVNDKVFETHDVCEPPTDYYIKHKYRMDAINLITNCIAKKKFNDLSFKDDINRFSTELEGKTKALDSLFHDDQKFKHIYIDGLIYDINGQVKEALNMTRQGEREDWFSRWGIHYLLSLKEAYQQEMCNNFKDRAISSFGGDLFNTLRDEVSNIFDERPLPKRDIQRTLYKEATPIEGRSTMSQYNNAGGGCCAEGSRVLMADGKWEKVENIHKGDRIMTYNSKISLINGNNDSHISYSTSTVECVVKTKCTDNKINMVSFNNLKITPYHPIINIEKNQNWIYPIDLAKEKIISCEYMYSFVIENRQSITVEGCVFSTYGHNLDTNNVIQHNYFGTDNVINDLRKFNSYGNGFVVLNQDQFIRDDNQVVAIR